MLIPHVSPKVQPLDGYPRLDAPQTRAGFEYRPSHVTQIRYGVPHHVCWQVGISKRTAPATASQKPAAPCDDA